MAALVGKRAGVGLQETQLTSQKLLSCESFLTGWSS
jgi:hypothetical protein